VLTGNTFQENVSQSNNWGAQWHVSEHTNAGGGRGTEVWHYPGSARGLALAQSIYNHLALITAAPDRGVKSSKGYGELANTRCPAVIIEAEFHDYFAGAEEIRTHHTEYATAIAEGILEIVGMGSAIPPAKPAPAPRPVAHPYPGKSFRHKKPMMIDSHVGLIQRRLCDHGIIVTKDDKFGPDTEKGVRRFQQLHHPLAEDGVVGPQTWAVMFT
jgi:hypothetical protein